LFRLPLLYVFFNGISSTCTRYLIVNIFSHVFVHAHSRLHKSCAG
jgi:hypothetical protein